MDSVIISSVITSVLTLIGVIITVVVSSSKNKVLIEQQIKSLQHEIEEMKADIKEHNNYATSIPVIKTEITHFKETLSEIKSKIGA